MLTAEGKRADPHQALMTFALLAVLASGAAWMITRQLGASGLGRYSALGIFLAAAGVAFHGLLTRRRLECCCALAYLTAVEPAVRGYAKGLPYLALEYVLIIVAILTVLQRRAPLRLPTFFLGLYLLLEAAGTLVAAREDDARWMVAMTAGRLALFVVVQRANLGADQALRVVASYMAGAVAMSAMALFGAFASDTRWSTQSNSEAAGGFGPNQVAGLLALGSFAAIFLADVDPRRIGKAFYLGLAGMMVLSALFTFTRGGSVILILGLLLYAVVLGVGGRISGALVGAALLLPVVALFAITYTDSVLVERYQQTRMSHREDIWALGLRIFWENPVLGVGTGNFYQASEGRLLAYHGRVGTHNEVIRALSEHGIVGACLWFSFVGASLAACWRENRGLARAATVSWVVMAVAFECHSGLKLAMSALFMALAVEGFGRRQVGLHRAPERGRAASAQAAPPHPRRQWA